MQIQRDFQTLFCAFLSTFKAIDYFQILIAGLLADDDFVKGVVEGLQNLKQDYTQEWQQNVQEKYSVIKSIIQHIISNHAGNSQCTIMESSPSKSFMVKQMGWAHFVKKLHADIRSITTGYRIMSTLGR